MTYWQRYKINFWRVYNFSIYLSKRGWKRGLGADSTYHVTLRGGGLPKILQVRVVDSPSYSWTGSVELKLTSTGT